MMIRKGIVVFLFLMISNAYAVEMEDLNANGLRTLLADAAKRDGHNGLTLDELQAVLGDHDEVITPRWSGNSQGYVYLLEQQRRLEVQVSDGWVMLAELVPCEGNRELVWK